MSFPAIDFTQLSVGVAAVAVNLYIVKTFVGFLSNHMSNISSSLESTAANLNTLNERVDRLHDDNVAAAREVIEAARLVRESNFRSMGALREASEGVARELKYADQTVTRKVEEQSK